MIDLKNKTALVTGGSRGIGRACVQFLSKAGAYVAFTYNKSEQFANELCNEFTDKNKVRSYKLDANNEDNINNNNNIPEFEVPEGKFDWDIIENR